MQNDVSGRLFRRWEGAYSLLQAHEQTNDPSSSEFDELRLPSTRQDGYHHRLYVIFSREKVVDDEAFEAGMKFEDCKSKEERLNWIIRHECEPRTSMM